MRLFLALLLLLAPRLIPAQALPDTVYQVELSATACPMVNFFRSQRIPGIENRTSFGYGASLRAMWHPGRLLAIGLLTGYFLVSDDEISAPDEAGNRIYTARFTAIPMQLALSMQTRRFEVGIGIGPYLVRTDIEGGGSPPVTASRLELGITFFSSYLFEVSDTFRIGPELRILSFRYRGIISLMPSCVFRYDILRY